MRSGSSAEHSERYKSNHKGQAAMKKRNFMIGLGAVAAVITVLVLQRDFIYGAKGNVGQGVHARF